MKEIKNISGYEISCGYFADASGIIYSNKGNGMREIGSENGDGYITVRLKLKNKKYKTFKRNRVIYSVFKGELKHTQFVNHINHLKKDDSIENLEIVNYSSNLKSKHNLCKELEIGRIEDLIYFYQKKIQKLKKKLKSRGDQTSA